MKNDYSALKRPGENCEGGGGEERKKKIINKEAWSDSASRSRASQNLM